MKPRARGFSLLEAIVALTVMASAMIALYGWLVANTLAMNRVRDNLATLEDQRSALALLDTVNPMAEPSGERKLGALTVRWRAEPITALQPGTSRAGQSTAFDLRLYELNVETRRAAGLPTRQFSVRKAGWVVARPFNPDDL